MGNTFLQIGWLMASGRIKYIPGFGSKPATGINELYPRICFFDPPRSSIDAFRTQLNLRPAISRAYISGIKRMTQRATPCHYLSDNNIRYDLCVGKLRNNIILPQSLANTISAYPPLQTTKAAEPQTHCRRSSGGNMCLI